MPWWKYHVAKWFAVINNNINSVKTLQRGEFKAESGHQNQLDVELIFHPSNGLMLMCRAAEKNRYEGGLLCKHIFFYSEWDLDNV